MNTTEKTARRTMKKTKVGNNYFNGSGAYQKELRSLWNELVPIRGCADSLHGELIRAICRLNHEYFNNGNINACWEYYKTEERICKECGGSGYVCYAGIEDLCDTCNGKGYIAEEYVEERRISSMFENFLRLIEEIVPDTQNEVAKIRNIITNGSCTFTDNEAAHYSTLIDKVLYFVLHSSNQPIPKSYDNK